MSNIQRVEKFNMVLAKPYTANGEEKTFWANVGRVTLFHKNDGSVSGIVEENHSKEQFQLFPVQDRQDAPAQSGGQYNQPYKQPQGQPAQPGEVEYPTEDINPDDIPF
jgi:hypothetical protein